MTQMMIGGASSALALFLVLAPHVGDLPDAVLESMTKGWSNSGRTFLGASMIHLARERKPWLMSSLLVRSLPREDQ